jgi:hypothetical protein
VVLAQEVEDFFWFRGLSEGGVAAQIAEHDDDFAAVAFEDLLVALRDVRKRDRVPAKFSAGLDAVGRARGGVFIRGRPSSCAGDRAFRMGTEMGGSRRCFRMLLE